jgi:hypothetical protein
LAASQAGVASVIAVTAHHSRVTIALSIGSLACLLAAAMALIRFLPAQNVAFIILFLVAVEVALEYWNEAGNLQEGAFFWPGAIVLLRVAGQKLLKPWRQNRHYGLFLIGLVSVFTAVLQLLFDSAQTAAARLFVTAVCLLFLTPWFLQKRVAASGESKK